MEQQIWPTKQPDGTIFERHVYSGPQGEGYIDIVYREKLDGTFKRKATHIGPELRESDKKFISLASEDERNVKLKRLKEDKAEWKPEIGFEVKKEFKEVIDEKGFPKPPKDSGVVLEEDFNEPK